jgi:cytochrome P450
MDWRREFDPWSAGFVADPYPVYAALREAGRAHWFEPTNQWLVAGYDDVNSLLRDRRLGRTYLHRFTHEEFEQPRPIPELEPFHVLNASGLLDLEPPDHGRIRRLVTSAFTPRMVQELRPAIERIAGEIVARFVTDGGGDLVTGIAEPLPVAVIAEMLGVPEADRPLLRPWSFAITRMFELNPGTDVQHAAVRATNEFSAYIRDLIEGRRRNPGPDLISALIAAHDEGQRLTEQEMISTCILLLNAGHEATVNATGTAWFNLFQHEDELTMLRQTPELIPQAVEELLRFDTPLQMFSRWVLDDVDIGDVTVGRGSQIALLFGSANRDPQRFADPDRLWMTRPDNKHISFGAGIHFCLGAALARSELHASFSALFQLAPEMRMAATPDWRPGYIIRGLRELLVEC